MKKKIIASVLSMSMIFSSMSFNVLAEDVVSEVAETTAVEEATVEETSAEDAETVENADVVAETDEEDAGTTTASVALNAAVTEGWVGGNSGGSATTLTGDYSSTVSIQPTKEKKGKWSNTSDEIGYYGATVDASKDFTLSADVKVDQMNTLSTGSATQSTVGIGVFNDITTKTTNSIAMSLYAAKSSDTYMDYKASYREDATKRYWVGDLLSTNNVKLTAGSTEGTTSIKLAKRSDMYVLTCGDKSTVIKDNGNILTNAQVTPAFFVARHGGATFSNIKLDLDDRTVASLEITTQPNTTEFVVGNQPDLTGMVVTAKYADGTSEVLDAEGYAVDVDIDALGVQNAYIKKGGVSVPLQVTYVKNRAAKINIVNAPVKNEYFIGQKVQAKGLEVEAEFLDGSKETLTAEQYELSLGGKVLDAETCIDANMAKDNAIKVKFVATDSVEAGSAYGSIPVTIYRDYAIDSLTVSSKPVTTVYYLNEELDLTGMVVKANYKNAAGSKKYDFLTPDEYVVDASAFDNTKAGKYKINVKYAADNSIVASFEVDMRVKEIRRIQVTNYPITTYNLDAAMSNKDAFDMTGLEVCYLYSSGQLDPLKVRNIIYSASDVETVNADGAFDIDLTKFSVAAESSVKNPTSVITIAPVDASLTSIKLPVTVKAMEDHYWKSVRFGASTNSSNKVDGNVADIEEDGSSANLTAGVINDSGTGSAGGKLATDHDGISYLYTRVGAENNFRLIADLTVNKYLKVDLDDTSRAGQEAFGLMLRDAIPFKDPKDPENGIVERASEAVKDSNGEPVPQNTGSDFCGNMVLLGGYSGTSYPTDKTAASYEKNRDINRINLAYRKDCQTYVTSKVGTPTRATVGATMNDNFFKKGDKFKLTLEKVNGGYKGTCYDYQTGKTESRTYTLEDGEILTTQDAENIYVGFFAARYCDFTVENVDFYITDPDTDIVARAENIAKVTPRITISSSDFVTTTKYNLTVRPSNKSGGYVTIKQDDKVIANNAFVSKKDNVFPTTLNADGSTKFTVYYTPRYVSTEADEYEDLTSYDEVVETYIVTHKGDYDQEADKIYVAPNGTFGGKGTKDAPYDLDTALGFIQRGQTIVLMDGVYYRDAKIDIPETKTGTSVAGMAMVADEGAEPIIDLQRKVGGLTLQGSYWTIRGIDFRHSADNQRAFQHSGNFCLIEDCKFYDNGDTGIQLSRSNGAYTSIKDWPHNNIFKNIEVWNSADPSGINADGIGVKLTVGNGNKCIGCVSHHNLDDGWDLYTKAGTGPIGVVVLEDCVSYCQGYKLERDGSTATSFWSNTAGHNGLKMGGENIAVQHVVRNCKIFMNGNSGISSNSNPCMTVRDSVSFKNKGGNVSLYSDNEEAYNYDLKGVVSYKGGGSDKIANYVAKDYNYINGKNASGEEVTDEFFKSVDPNSVLTNGRLAQDAEGNFITGDFLELTDAVKAKIASVEGYEDPIVETTTEEVWTPDKDDDDDSNKGGGSAKRSSKVVDKEDKEDSTEKASEKETAEEESEKSSEDVTEGETSEAEKEENKENSNEEEKVVDFKDMKDNWAKPYVEALVKAGVVNGVTETEFAPNAKITRGDFTKMLVTALGLTTEDKHGFADVNESDYYSAEIAAAKAFGLVSGTSEVTFGPKNSITRQDAMTIMARAIDSLKLNAEGEAGDLSQFSDANAIAGYAKDAVAKLVGLGVINGADGKVNPTDNITRAETAKLIYDIMAMATSEK